jgi:hypothetical protein
VTYRQRTEKRDERWGEETETEKKRREGEVNSLAEGFASGSATNGRFFSQSRADVVDNAQEGL